MTTKVTTISAQLAPVRWQWANDSPVWLKPRRTLYFLVRHLDNYGAMEYRRDKRGRLITYSTREQAIRIQDRLNGQARKQENQ